MPVLLSPFLSGTSSSRPGGTATNISRAPTSIPAALGSNTGRSFKHISLFRLRHLGFVLLDCRCSSYGMSIVARFLSYKQRPSRAREDNLPNGMSQVSPAVNHCFAHGTWNHATDRCCKAHHASTAYFRCLLLHQRMQEPLRRAKFLSALPGHRPGPLLLRNEYLAAENRILRAQFKGRLLLSDAEKATLAEIGHRLGRKALKNWRLSRSRIRC